MWIDLKQLKKTRWLHAAHEKFGKPATVANVPATPNSVSQKLTAAMGFP